MTEPLRLRRPGLGVLSPRELRTLMREPDRRRTLGKRDAALLAVLAGGGLRVGEAVSLTLYDVEQAGPWRLQVRQCE